MLSPRPLGGIRVVDLTSNVAAPFASAVLADLGASVVHVEGPRGDDCRRMSPVRGDSSAYFEVVNRGKDVVVLDVRTPDGRQALDDLLDGADVLVTNLRPGKLEGLRLDAASLAKDHPRLIHASLSAYGPTGPERDKPGYDAVLQARTGIAAVTGTADGPPVRAGVSILDVGAGTWLALGVVTALYERERTGHGGAVATSLFETGASWVAYHVAAHQVTGQPSGRHGSGHPAFAPYGIFATGAGEICLGIGGDALFVRLCEAIDRTDLLADERFATNADRSAHSAALRTELERTLASASADDWAQRLSTAGLPVDAVQRPEDLLSDPQAQRTGILVDLPGADLRVPGVPVTFDGARPQPAGPTTPTAG
jgi:crotonobetainyl-CoA:carnitine CoA-transferase CaiB-like acyl-CoA transferase